jgi:hypothetical protein
LGPPAPPRHHPTVDVLFDITNSGLWMAYCHIAEYMRSGTISASPWPAGRNQPDNRAERRSAGGEPGAGASPVSTTSKTRKNVSADTPWRPQ